MLPKLMDIISTVTQARDKTIFSYGLVWKALNNVIDNMES